MNKRVLIIDPNRESGYMHASALRNKGIYAVSVPSMSIAFQLLKKSDFSLILTDVFQELLNSFSIFNRMNVSKILLFTNVCEKKVISEGMRRGADGYIIKSRVSEEEFVRLIQTYNK